MAKTPTTNHRPGGYEHPGTNSTEARLFVLAGLAREAADNMRAATLERDRLIVKMRETGATLQSIAKAVGMTHPGVMSVLERNKTNG